MIKVVELILMQRGKDFSKGVEILSIDSKTYFVACDLYSVAANNKKLTQYVLNDKAKRY